MAVVSAAIRVLIVDDDALVRAGLKLMIGSADDLQVVGEAEDGTQVLALLVHDAGLSAPAP